MITLYGLRQQQLLTLLLQNKEGLTVEGLSKGLGITDNAVRQHLTALERDGMVARGETQSTGGRPEHLYHLTTAGEELFPRQYSWFAELLINSLREEQGTDALRERLEGMGKAVGRQVAGRLAGVKDKRERIRALSGIMRELGYQSGSIDSAREMASYRGDQLCFSYSRQMLSGSLPLRFGHDVRSCRLQRSSR